MANIPDPPTEGMRSAGLGLDPHQARLCLETQSRQIMATLVNEVVADAMRLGLYDKPAEHVVTANGAPFRRTAG